MNTLKVSLIATLLGMIFIACDSSNTTNGRPDRGGTMNTEKTQGSQGTSSNMPSHVGQPGSAASGMPQVKSSADMSHTTGQPGSMPSTAPFSSNTTNTANDG